MVEVVIGTELGDDWAGKPNIHYIKMIGTIEQITLYSQGCYRVNLTTISEGCYCPKTLYKLTTSTFETDTVTSINKLVYER